MWNYLLYSMWALAVRRDTHKGSTAGQPNRTNDCMWVLAATGNIQFQIESMLAVRRDTQAAIKTIGFEAHESNRSEETQLSLHRPCAPTCPATHSRQFRRHPRCYHRMHRETFNYIHHVTALRRIVIRTSKVLCRLQLQFWNNFTCTCAFRHSARQFFHSGTSKNAPRTTVF